MDKSAIETRVKTVISFLDERQKRIYLAAEAEALGWGGSAQKDIASSGWESRPVSDSNTPVASLEYATVTLQAKRRQQGGRV